MIIRDSRNKVIIDIVNQAEAVENGILTEKGIYTNGSGYLEVVDIATLEGAQAQKHILNDDETLTENPNYVEPIDPDQELRALKLENQNLKDRLAATEADNLTTLGALAEVYEMMLAMQA